MEGILNFNEPLNVELLDKVVNSFYQGFGQEVMQFYLLTLIFTYAYSYSYTYSYSYSYTYPYSYFYYTYCLAKKCSNCIKSIPRKPKCLAIS